MLQINPVNVCRLIQLAQEIHAQEQVTIPEESLAYESDDHMRQVLAGHHNDMFVGEFKSIVADMEPDQQCQLVALYWQGRGEFSLDEWPQAMRLAKQEWTPDTADYLLKHPLLASELTEGLEMQGFRCEINE